MSLRVILQQPALPHYRIPVFRELATRSGLDVQVIYGDTMGKDANVEPDGFEAHYVPVKLLGGGRFMWHQPQVSFARRGTCDVLLASWSSRYLSLPFGLVRAKMAGIGTVLWGHGYSKNESPTRAKLREFLGRRGDALLFYDQLTADRYVQTGHDATRVFTAVNAIDQKPVQEAREQWLREPATLQAFREEKQLGSGPVLLYVSRISQENRLDLLVDALPIVAKRFPQVKAVLVGKGQPQLIEKLKQQAATVGVENSLLFTGPIYDEKTIAPYFLAADVFVYPINIGLSILHAFGYGLPVVTSDLREAQNPEIVALHEGVNGLTYRHNDPQALADTLIQILGNSKYRNEMAQQAHYTVMKQFSIPRMVDGMEAAIRCAADRRK